MNREKMEQLREIVNVMICSDDCDSAELVKKSQELDKLILEEVKKNIYVKKVFGEEFVHEFEVLLDSVQLLDKMYDFMRIVDPVKKEVLEIKKGRLCRVESECHKFWERKEVCENCISMRACKSDVTVTKMEYLGHKVYMITAVPVSIHGKKLAVEFLKDVTGSLYLHREVPGYEVEMFSAIEHMNRAVVKDELTGLYNRRFIYERLPVELFKTSISNEPLSIIFLDLDSFKYVNDRYGHHEGDRVLHQFAHELRRHIDTGKDWIARCGGEEFMICLPGTGSDAAHTAAERIGRALMGKDFAADSEGIHLTASFGVYTASREDESLTVEDMIEIAYKNLYKAKEEARNKAV